MTVTKYFLGIKNISNLDSLDKIADFKNIKIILPQSNTFIADPFLFKYNNDYYAFFESWDYNYGTICCSKLDSEYNFTNIEKCLDLKFHLSFPCIFEYKNNIYMIPETGAKKSILLYKCLEFPKKWKFVKIIKNIYSPDVSFYVDNNIIYLLSGNEKTKKLSIYYSTDLFDNFIEHSSSPAIENPRNAGNIFEFNNNLYRPCQICTPSYGYAIGIYKINELSTKKYSETLVKIIKPEWFPKLTGTHTLNICDNLLITDGRLRIKSPNMKKINTIKGGQVYKSTDNDKYCNSYMNKLLIKYKSINLENLPQNIVDKYCKSKNMNSVNTSHKSIDQKKILFETTKKYSHYRIIYENKCSILKLINFNDTCLDIFLSQVKYDIFFKKAIENNFYNTISLVNNFIYDSINDEYIGYCTVKMEEIKKYDEIKFKDLVNRLVNQYKETDLVFTDLTINTKYKSNVMEYKDKYYIIDLESVCDMETYIKYKDLRFKNNNKYYEKMLGL